MKSKAKQGYQGLMSFKRMALWLLAYKIYRDYIEVIKLGYTPEPEKFFESWEESYAPSGYSKREKECVWSLFLALLVARMEYKA